MSLHPLYLLTQDSMELTLSTTPLKRVLSLNSLTAANQFSKSIATTKRMKLQNDLGCHLKSSMLLPHFDKRPIIVLVLMELL